MLYSEKIVIEQGSSSGEKRLATETVSASATFETNFARGAVIIRVADNGRKPIAFKVASLLTRKSKKTLGKRRHRRPRLTLAPQQPKALEQKNLVNSAYSK